MPEITDSDIRRLRTDAMQTASTTRQTFELADASCKGLRVRAS